MMKTRAAVLRKGGTPWEITELDLDEPKAGEVLVRMEAAGLCHSDEHIRATGTARLPLVGGHEGAGVIERTGPGVTRVTAGDRVACSYIPVCGTCRYCSTGKQNLCDAGKNAAIATDGGLPAGTSAVSATLLRTCEFVDNRHTPDPEHVLNDIADTISRTGSLIFKDTSAGVVLCPEHAQMLAGAGFSKHDVQSWLIEHCGRTGADLRRVGKNGLRGPARFADPDDSADDAVFSRILPSPRHVPIVVAGARNAAISMVVRVFGEWSGTATQIKTIGNERGRVPAPVTR